MAPPQGAYRLLEHHLGTKPEPALLASCVRLRRHAPRVSVAAQKFFDKRHTATKQVREGMLGAEPPCGGLDNLVASVSGRGLHASR